MGRQGVWKLLVTTLETITARLYLAALALVAFNFAQRALAAAAILALTAALSLRLPLTFTGSGAGAEAVAGKTAGEPPKVASTSARRVTMSARYCSREARSLAYCFRMFFFIMELKIQPRGLSNKQEKGCPVAPAP